MLDLDLLLLGDRDSWTSPAWSCRIPRMCRAPVRAGAVGRARRRSAIRPAGPHGGRGAGRAAADNPGCTRTGSLAAPLQTPRIIRPHGSRDRVKFRSIAVEGPIGVGKTSFVELLARKFDAYKVLEDRREPVPGRSTRTSPAPRSRPSCFSCCRVAGSCRSWPSATCSIRSRSATTSFPRTRSSPTSTSTTAELLIYDKLYADARGAGAQARPGDLPPGGDAGVLIERIRKSQPELRGARSRRTYVNEVNKAYNYFFFHYNADPAARDRYDARSTSCKHEEHLDELLEQIRKMEHGACSTIARWAPRCSLG